MTISIHKRKHSKERDRHLRETGGLADKPDILAVFLAAIRDAGVAHEDHNLKILFLATVSRLFQKPISVAIKADTSAGKSFELEKVLSFFPDSSHYEATSMSEKALVYSGVSLRHRMLVIYEAAGVKNDWELYLRTLLSEGKIRYPVSVRKKGGEFATDEYVCEGPTGLLTTTTALSLNPENETRMFSITINSSRARTAAIIQAQAEEPNAVDLKPWHALQEYLACGPTDVVIPFGSALASSIRPEADRLHRDHIAIRTFIKAHALLHQRNRKTTPRGEIVATLEDYERVWELIADVVSVAAEATVSRETRDIVEAVAALSDKQTPTSIVNLATYMNVNKSTASRRAKKAVLDGYLLKGQRKKGVSADLAIGQPLPIDVDVIPDPLILRIRYLRQRLKQSGKSWR